MEDNILFEKPKVRLFSIPLHPDALFILRELSEASLEERPKLLEERLDSIRRVAAITQDVLAIAEAKGCEEEKSSFEILSDLMSLPPEELAKEIEKTSARSAGRGHGSVLDPEHFTYSIENLPRAATLQLCLPEYLEHEQQSFRRAKASRGFYIPPAIKESKLFEETKKILSEAFKLYEEMNDDDRPDDAPADKKTGIKGEDARYVLPLYAKTNITTTGNIRELQHLHAMNKQGEVPSIVQETIEQIIQEGLKIAPVSFKNRDKNYETLAWRPSSQLFASENRTLEALLKNCSGSGVSLVSHSGFPVTEQAMYRAVKERNEAELSNLKHIHFDFLVPMSLVTYHQATRQRSWHHAIESAYHAFMRGNIITPPSIENSPFKEKYENMNKRMLELYERLIGYGVPRAEAIGVVPHSLQIYDYIHVDGWNAIHSIGKRTCRTAQWEIRKIANEMADCIREVNPALGKYAVPQGILYGGCPEAKKKSCGYCDGVLAKQQSGKL